MSRTRFVLEIEDIDCLQTANSLYISSRIRVRVRRVLGWVSTGGDASCHCVKARGIDANKMRRRETPEVAAELALDVQDFAGTDKARRSKHSLQEHPFNAIQDH